MGKGDSPQGKLVALIAGPTASGKSALAVALAQRLEAAGRRAVVLNADSAQVYADLAVLSARPSLDEMGGIEHRLFGAWDGATPCSAADWAAAAKREIAALHAEGAVPVLVGGTGLYVRTLLEGIAPVPEIDPDVRAAVRTLPVGEAYAALQAEDPERASRLAPADSQRIARALEGHSAVRQVLYPGLASHPQAELAARQMETGGTMIAIDLHGGKDGAFAGSRQSSALRMLSSLGIVLR